MSDVDIIIEFMRAGEEQRAPRLPPDAWARAGAVLQDLITASANTARERVAVEIDRDGRLVLLTR